jgi:hypothetical protein
VGDPSLIPLLFLDRFDARLCKLGTPRLGIDRARLIPADGITTMVEFYNLRRFGEHLRASRHRR